MRQKLEEKFKWQNGENKLKREEWEQFEIRKSVKLDLKNKRIQCTLPLIGKERDFLTCNRGRALKILMQQCNKYHTNKETKDIILKAFSKLFDNSHAALVRDVSKEDLDIFINKDPQYFITWRFSLKTPYPLHAELSWMLLLEHNLNPLVQLVAT